MEAKNNVWLIVIIALLVGGVAGYALSGVRQKEPTPQPAQQPPAQQEVEKQAEAPAESNIEVKIHDPSKILAEGLKEKSGGFEFSVLSETPTGSVELFKINDEVKMHLHEKENHFLYIVSGQAEGTIADVKATVGPGQIVQIPRGVPHAVKKLGTEPFVFVLFSTPPFNSDDIEWLDQ